MMYDDPLKTYKILNCFGKIPSDVLINGEADYYLLYQAVSQPDSVTTKLLMVFNASKSTSN